MPSKLIPFTFLFQNFIKLAVLLLLHTSSTSSQAPHHPYHQYVPQFHTQYSSHQSVEDQFAQQQQQIHQQIDYFNRQQLQSLQNEMQAVHNENSAPQFDFMVNGNYTDIEKASEQFVDVSNMMGKQKHQPKVIKITKTVAVKVPVVKYVKVPVPMKPEHPAEDSALHNYEHYPVLPTVVTPHKPEKYVPAPKAHPAPTHATPSYENSVFDTKPYYARDPNDPKTMIKYIPVPVYTTNGDGHSKQEHVSAAYSHGNQHEDSNQHSEDESHHETHYEYKYAPSHAPVHHSPRPQETAYEYKYASATPSPSSYYHYHSDSTPSTTTSSHVYHPHPSQNAYHHALQHSASQHQPQTLVRYVYE